MPLLEDMERINAAQGGAAAIDHVRRLADADDAEALLMRGEWRLWGAYLPQDLAGGYADIARAAALGDPGAAMAQANLLASGTGVASDFAAARAMLDVAAAHLPIAAEQAALLARMSDRLPPAAQMLSADPPVFNVEALLDAEECAYLIARAEPRLQPSSVVDPVTGARIPHPIRTSDGTNFSPLDEDLVLHAINRRIAAATGTHVGQGEPLHVLRYRPGQEYRPHLDGLPAVRNQRVLTALVYLNDDYEGGETDFRLLHLRVRGQAGDALVFRNSDAQGRADPRTEHAGLPVSDGVKWLASRWIRGAPFHPWRPETTV